MEKNYYTNKFCESLELYLKMKMLKYVEYYLDTIPSDDRRNVDSIITRNQFTLEEINDLLIDYSPVEFDDSDLFSMAFLTILLIASNVHFLSHTICFCSIVIVISA